MNSYYMKASRNKLAFCFKPSAFRFKLLTFHLKPFPFQLSPFSFSPLTRIFTYNEIQPYLRI